MNTKEIWKPVLNFEGLYEVSSLGRVRAMYYGNHGQYKPMRILKPHAHQNRYLFVVLYYSSPRKTKARSVHSLVLEAFKGPRPIKGVARHLDGIRINNTLANLEWGTSAQNYDDSRKHQTNCEGERNGFSILTANDVVEMRRLRGEGMTYKALGAMFNTHWSNAWLIIKNRTWRSA